MTIFLTIIHVIVCFMLIIVILLQAGRGQGLTGPSFGGNVQSLFGTRAADFLTKATTVSAICFLFTCIGLNLVELNHSKSLLEAGGVKTRPVDVDLIKKALEKVKDEQAAKADAGKVEVAQVPSKDAEPTNTEGVSLETKVDDTTKEADSKK